MSSVSASSKDNMKQVMRTALVGVKPADQVMLKGYLRVLLRLEADLEWVSANHPQVDLYMINNDFSQSVNIIKLLESNNEKPVLYVGRSPSNEGDLTNNLLTLPLREMNIFNNWLLKNIKVLNQKKSSRLEKNKKKKIFDNELKKNNIQYINNDLQSTNNNLAEKVDLETEKQSSIDRYNDILDNKEPVSEKYSTTTRPDDNYSKNTTFENSGTTNNQSINNYGTNISCPELTDVIQQLYQSEKGFYQLFSAESVVAVIEMSRSLVWIADDYKSIIAKNKLTSLRLQQTLDTKNKVENAVDMRQWLWDMSCVFISELQSLITWNQAYQIQHWIKPDTPQNRGDLLRVMTAMEKSSLTVQQIAEISDTPESYVKGVLSRLLFSGLLQDSVYKNISINMNVNNSNDNEPNISNSHSTHENIQPSRIASSHNNQPSTVDSIISRRAAGGRTERKVSSEIPLSVFQKQDDQKPLNTTKKPEMPKKTEKQGFLSRLRRKLGL